MIARETFSFTNDFQDLILACLIREPEKFVRYGPILDSRFFSGVHATITARCVLKYATDYNRFPTFEALGQLAQDEAIRFGEEDRQAVLSYVEKLSQIQTGDAEMVSQKVVSFARERAILGRVRQVLENMKDGKPTDDIVPMFEEAMRVGQNLDDLGYLLHRDWERVIDKVSSVEYGTRTGFTHLDDIWRRGWGPGWLIVPLAPPKRYKTVFCINMALSMAGPTIAGDILYYACEITSELTACRAFFNLSGMTQDQMYDTPVEFKKRVYEQLQATCTGNVLVKHYPSGMANISEIRAHAQTAVHQLGLKPKAIFIDYAETINPESKSDRDHRQQASIYTDARALGGLLGCPVIMPDRCNRETVDKATPDMKSFQGAFQKGGIVDVAIGLCATENEYLNNVLRMFIFLNRHGPAFQHFRCKVDPIVSRITIEEKIEYTPEEPEKQSKRRRQTTSVPDELVVDGER